MIEGKSKGISLEGIGKVYSEKSEVWSEKNKAVGGVKSRKKSRACMKGLKRFEGDGDGKSRE